MEEDTNINSKMKSIKEKLDVILDDDDIELAFCIFTIKKQPETIIAQVGHFYDVTRLLTSAIRDIHSRMHDEIGL